MKLLVAEDEKDLAYTLKKVLEIYKYEVDIVFNGIEVLNKLKDNTYDLIILDVMMPKLDGYETCIRIKENKILTPILILTAKSNQEDKDKAFSVGANGFITKPFTIKELLTKISELLNEKEYEKINYNSIILDPKFHELIGNKITIRITNDECLLLEKLFKNNNLKTNEIKELLTIKKDDYINLIFDIINSLNTKLNKIESNLKIIYDENLGYKVGVINA